MECRDCNKEVNKMFKGKMRPCGRRIYVDDTGRQWLGINAQVAATVT